MSSVGSSDSQEEADEANLAAQTVEQKPPEVLLEELRKELEKERRRGDGLLERLKYIQADFENYQKRAKKEHDEFVKLANEKLMLKLIGIVDDFERALDAGRKSEDKHALAEGLEMIFKQLMISLQEEGLETIEALGKPFDPNKHEAVSYLETAESPDNTVIHELRKGYTLNGRVIRPSMVQVARQPLPESNQVTK